MQPCLDDFYTTFDDYAQMHGYHARQTRESKWTRNTVSGLHIEPLDEASPTAKPSPQRYPRWP